MKRLVATVVLLFYFHPAIAKDIIQNIPIQVNERGFVPTEINVKPGTHVFLQITRIIEATCAKQIKISGKKIKKDLPLNKEVSIDLGLLAKGDIRFACGMDMVSGHIIIK